jgi:tetratricopeptide (TPR) repeat protein
MRGLGLARALFCISTSVVAAPTPDPRAASEFREGRAAFARGDARGAAEHFEQAYRLAPHAATIYNAGAAWDAAGERARAADDYELALELGGMSETYVADAQERLAALQKVVGVLLVTEPRGASISVAHVSRLRVPAHIHLAPGTYEVSVHSSGDVSVKRSVSIRAGEQSVLSVHPSEFPPAPRPEVLVQAAPRVVEHRRVPMPSAWAFTAWSLAAASAAGSVALGVSAVNAKHAFEATGSSDPALRARASTLRTWTNVGWGVSALLAGGGFALWLLPRPPAASPVQGVHVGVTLSPDGFVVAGIF